MNTSPQVVLDGSGLVTLSGEGRRRILYMDTCDRAQVWTTSHCQDQAAPQLVIQNLSFADGDSSGQRFDGGGGGDHRQLKPCCGRSAHPRPVPDDAEVARPRLEPVHRRRDVVGRRCGRPALTDALDLPTTL
jgi:hypothetical protein